MKLFFTKNPFPSITMVVVLIAIIFFGISWINRPDVTKNSGYIKNDAGPGDMNTSSSSIPSLKKEKKPVPVYTTWQNFYKKDGLPHDKINAVKIDGDRIWVGTADGLALYENGKFKVFNTQDGLAHHGVLYMDVSPVTGDLWIATLAGLNRYSAGKFDTWTQFNSGMPNDVIYQVHCMGKDVWVATGGGAGRLDTYTGQWSIFTEQNAPMHEPWTYAVSSGGGKVYIAAWGGGIIEYDPVADHFRDYVDPDEEMEIDLFPNDGPVHDITTSASFQEGILWVGSYFGLSRYDGNYWFGYFDHDSGLASNFINLVKAYGPVGYSCTDNGLSTFDGETWVTYRRLENGKGEVLITKGNETTRHMASTTLSNNFLWGVDIKEDTVWVASAKGLSMGVVQKNASAETPHLIF